MLYRVRSRINKARLDRRLAGIMQTPPVTVTDDPVCVVSIVTTDFIPMYLCSLKSFFPKLGGGKVVALIERGMGERARATLSAHVRGIELVAQEEIETGPVQRGGCWERLLYCLDRSRRDYTIQLDGDMLTLAADIDEVTACVQANRAFAMADGFARQTLPEAAAMAEATPSDYIGMLVERGFARYPGAEHLHYVRASAGFAGFARGGFPRERIVAFHEEMERLLGAERWRIWGTEQCASNFAIANSPDPTVLPYPQYASFTPRVQRQHAKLFHFIGAFRYLDGYYGRRAQEVIAAAAPGAAPVPPPPPTTNTAELPGPLPLPFARSLTRDSVGRYLRWQATGRSGAVPIQLRPRREFRSDRPPGPQLELRAADVAAARDVFARAKLFPPAWIPPERVERIVDLAPGVGLSCLWWLGNYWRPAVEAWQPDPEAASRVRANVGLNSFADRFTLHERTANLGALEGRHIDILHLGADPALLDQPGFDKLDVDVLVWHGGEGQGLEALGFRTYPGASGMMWAYRASPWGPFSAAPDQAVGAEAAA
ncbi:MAG: hypothetical protein JOZ05_10375 [Acetobacteraceae bacterium]|nr:hypothetical protein [Acetobacteraceae bacterium]